MSIVTCKCGKRIDTDDVESCVDIQWGEDTIIVCLSCGEKDEAERAAELAYYRADYDAAPLSVRDPEQYRRDMIDAGRGHLLPENWESPS